jgi:hypothetical protein
LGVAQEGENAVNSGVRATSGGFAPSSFIASLSSLLQRHGILPQSSNPNPSVIRPPQSYTGSILGQGLGGIPSAEGSGFRPAYQSTQVSSQTPPASSNLVSPAALNASMNAAQPTEQRSGRAFVPTTPTPAVSGNSASPATLMSQMARTGANVGAAAGNVSPAPVPTPTGIGSEAPSPGLASSFGAAVPTDAVTRFLASRGDNQPPAGYVETPEATAFGARLHRKNPSQTPTK